MPTVQSVASTAFASAQTVVITKPTGVAVGDLLLAFIYHIEVSVTPPAGWSTLATDDDVTGKITSFYKIATSTEVAASNFTFDQGSTNEIAGGMLRIDGHSAGSPVWDSGFDDQTNGGTTPLLTMGVITSIANSLLVGCIACSAGTGVVSAFAVATSNPSWTEAFQHTTTDSVDFTFAVYYATRPELTDTGDVSASFTGAAASDWVGILASFPPSKDFSKTETMAMSDSKLGDITENDTETLALTEDVDADLANPVSNVDKNLESWVNQDKS